MAPTSDEEGDIMGRMRDAIRAWAMENGYKRPKIHDSDDGVLSSFAMERKGEHETYRMYLDGNEELEVLTSMAYFPGTIPPNRRLAVAELLTRINPRGTTGHFAIDLDDGQCCYRGAIDVEGGEATMRMLDNLDAASLVRMDKHFPLIAAVAFGNRAPVEVLLNGATPESPVADVAAAPAWAVLSGTNVVRQWADELAAARDARSGEEWSLTGHAALIEHEDWRECQRLAQRIAAHAGLAFAALPAEQVREAGPDLATRFHALAPVLVFLEPGDWLRRVSDSNVETDASREQVAFQYATANGLRTFDPEAVVVVVTSARDLDFVAPPFLELGAFDRTFEVPPASKETTARLWLEQLGVAIAGDSLVNGLDKLGALLRNSFAAREERELAALHLKRLARRAGRRIEFDDLFHLVVRGAAERDAPTSATSAVVTRKTAIHEAGHALTAILESKGLNVPDYASIVPGKGFAGIVVESVSYFEAGKDDRTYFDVRQKVRVCLAGRAAEDLVFGSGEASAGAAQDLERATRTALDAFGSWGFAPGMDRAGSAGRNLATVVGPWNDGDYNRVYPLVREFLEAEYTATTELLASHRALLQAIADRLMADPVVDQAELQELCAQHDVACQASAQN